MTSRWDGGLQKHTAFPNRELMSLWVASFVLTILPRYVNSSTFSNGSPSAKIGSVVLVLMNRVFVSSGGADIQAGLLGKTAQSIGLLLQMQIGGGEDS